MAIAFDASAQGTTGLGSAASLTIAHTCSGSNRVLIVCVQTVVHAIDVTGVTYNGVTMTLLDDQDTGIGYMYVFYLLAPATGTHNIVISATPNILMFAVSGSWTGIRQGLFPDAETKNIYSGSSNTTTLTTVIDNCWCVLADSAANTSSAGTNSTSRVNQGAALYDSNGPITPPGSFSMSVNRTGGGGDIMFSMAPAGGTITKTLSETVTHTDTIQKQTNRILLESVAHTDAIVKQRIKAKMLIESVAHTDTIQKQKVSSKTLTETVTHTDTLVHFRTASKILTETVHHTDTFLRTIGRTFREIVTHLDSFATPGFWRDRTRPTSTWTDRNKPSDSWTDRSKPSTSWSESPPPESSWDDRTKPPTTWSS